MSRAIRGQLDRIREKRDLVEELARIAGTDHGLYAIKHGGEIYASVSLAALYALCDDPQSRLRRYTSTSTAALKGEVVRCTPEGITSMARDYPIRKVG